MRPTQLEHLTDAQLLALVGSPDDPDGQAFAAFYRRHEQKIVGYLRRRVPRSDIAADLTAETFAAALQAAPRFDGDQAAGGDAAGWLLTIAHNKLLSSLKRGRVADETRLRLQMTEPLVLEDQALSRVDDLASLPEDLDRHVAALPEDQRVALLARVVEERTYEEIAAQLQCSELVVRQRVSRSLARLRRSFSPEVS